MSTEADTAELARLRAELERADVLYHRACEVEHKLRAEVERLTAVLYHRVCEVEHALRADLERFTGHGLLDCHAICDQRDAAIARAERAEADRNEFFRDTARLDWLLQDNVVRFDTSYHDRAAIDAAMKEDSR